MTLPGAFASARACACCTPLDDGDEGGGDAATSSEASSTAWLFDEAALSAARASAASLFVFDSHCHTHSGPRAACDARMYEGVTQAVDEAEWLEVLKRKSGDTVGFGVHPWQAHLARLAQNGFQDRLEAMLLAHPEAIVGEIGLCKCARNVRGDKAARATGAEAQAKVFEVQLDVALKLGRPASVHCVRAHKELRAALAAALGRVGGAEAGPRASVALHSFSGSAADVRALLEDPAITTACDVYFGFSHTVNVLMAGKRDFAALLDAVRAVPEDRLLVESDVSEASTAHAATLRAVLLVAHARKWPAALAAEKTAANARSWLRRPAN
ncbi:TatD family [Pelagophyceae sp. CCMP2097]|nr:TatD family [Pelagophyceae sp. CCMP2097]